MREIKFRAWDVEAATMHSIELDPAEWCISAIQQTEVWIPMQFTGLTDCNGVEIYEGDIVNYGCLALNDSLKFGPEPWDNLPEGVNPEAVSTILSTHRIDFFIPSLMALKQAIESNPDVRGVEVIGNIHENPELLTPSTQDQEDE